MEKIHIRFMKDLRNHDFGELFDAIYNVVQDEKILVPSVVTAVELLEPHCKKMLRMKSVKRTHPLTQVIQKQVATRTEYLGSLRLSVEAKMLSHIYEERAVARRLKLWLSPYKDKIYAHTIHRQSRMVEDLLSDREQDVEIKQATALLQLDDLVGAIAKVNATIRQKHIIRMNEKEEYVVDGLAMRDEAYDDLKVFINVMEANYKIITNNSEKEQLAELSSLINENLKDFRTLLRSRTTKKKNQKEAEKATKDLINGSSENKSERDSNNSNNLEK